MADALCGPSNPLQNLQKHTQIDRTLQQDRLVGPAHSAAQAFRTADPRAGSLDADFHAFEHAAPSPFPFQQPDFANAFPAFRPQSQPALGGWASDFQRLSIHEQPVPAQQFRTEAPLVRSTVGGWQNEFMRQRSSATTPISQGKQAMREPQLNNYAAPSAMMNYSQPMYQQYSGMTQNGGFQEQQQQQHPLPMEQQAQMSDVDFEAAFADAFAHAQEMDHALQQPTQPLQETVEPAENMKIGSDAIQYREWKDRTADQDTRDADELARTAGQLLHSVQHDTSTKFQNSTFLDLMRRIRDREVEVQNNDLTNVATGQAASATVDTTTEHSVQRESAQTHHPSADLDSHFAFPNMDTVYAPSSADLDGQTEPATRHRFAGSWDYPPASAADWNDQQTPAMTATAPPTSQSPYTSYGFDDDQYPEIQAQALHPGGKYYPDQSPRVRRAEMSGAVSGEEGSNGTPSANAISAKDFDYVDESPDLARRFR